MNNSDHIKNGSVNIFLVEDDPDDVLIFKDMLKENLSDPFPHNIQNAFTLHEALEKIPQEKYDVIFLDLHLPDSNGIDTFTTINKSFPDTPIILLTGLQDHNFALEALSLGAQDYLVKGAFNSQAIRRVIRYSIERKQLLNKIEQSSEERFRKLIEEDSDGMMVTDLAGQVLFVNPAALSILNLSEKELLGNTFPYPINPNSHTEIEITLPHSQRTRSIEMKVLLTEWEKHPAYLASIHDITETREIERLKAEMLEREKLDTIKDNFISVVSHEIRTPLTIIKASLSNLEAGVNGELNPKQREVLSSTLRNVERLNRIIKDILDLSRLESGRAVINVRKTKFQDILEEVKEGFIHEAQEKNIKLEFDVAHTLPILESDPDLIIQILNNLFANALRFAKSTVQLKAFETPHLAIPSLEVVITDDGDGIPADKMHLLFNKFEQINRPSGGAGYKGTGLGLAICKEIIDLLHGKIWANCEKPRQTEFHFIIPLKYSA